jgi:hypothetical protein
MKSSELGINIKTGSHLQSPLTRAESAFLGILWVDHVGRENALAADLFAEIFRARLHMTDRLEQVKRDIRELQNHLIIHHDIPVYSVSGTGGGYFIGEEQDAAEFYEAFRERGLTGLTKASRGRRSGMVDAVVQLSFRWRELVTKAGLTAPDDGDDVNAPIQVVDAVLNQLVKDPEKFARGLRMLGEKYGSVLVPRDRYEAIVGAIEAQAQTLSKLAGELRA